MALQNRVTPEGEIVATPARGEMFGIRGGCFHNGSQQLKRGQPWASNRWICCVLSFKGRRRALMQPGRYTELFFLDEATAMSAGHRPCFECRRADAERFARLWPGERRPDGRAAAPVMDLVLHAERLDGRTKRTWRVAVASLPDGTFIRREKGIRGETVPQLLLGDALRPWSFQGYGPPERRPRAGLVEVLTPPSIVAVLAAGYRPGLHRTLAAAVQPYSQS